MNDHTLNTVGVDISKAALDVHELPTGRSAQFANSADGFKKLADWVAPDTHCVVYESTGPWHRALEDALADELPLSRVNAARARRFAQAAGELAKTDAVDARVLAMMGAALKLRRVQPPSPEQRDLAELQTARDALIKDRITTSNRKHQARMPLIKKQIECRLAQIHRQIRRLDAEIESLIAASEQLSRQAVILSSIPGIARITAAGLISAMPELGRIDAKAAASLAGLAPMTRQSGQWKGHSFIQAGRSKVRRMLYMSAVTAIRHNPDLARKYQELRERGKPPKVALTAVMRNLIVLANALLKQDRTWSPAAPRPVLAAAGQ